MRHAVYGRTLSRTKNERRRLFQGLVRDMFIHGRIKTTLAKAKAVAPLIEQLITKAKRGTNADKIQIEKEIALVGVERKLFAEAATRFAGRTSGYTQILKLGVRKGDGAEAVVLQFVDVIAETEVIKPKTVKTETGAAKKKEIKNPAKKAVSTTKVSKESKKK